MTEPGGRAWKQATFHPFALTAAHATAEVLRVEPDSPRYETARYRDLAIVDAVATLDTERGQITVFAVNCSTRQPVHLAVDCRALGRVNIITGTSLHGDDLALTNSADTPTAVVPLPNRDVRADVAHVQAVLPPASWTMLRLSTS